MLTVNQPGSTYIEEIALHTKDAVPVLEVIRIVLGQFRRSVHSVVALETGIVLVVHQYSTSGVTLLWDSGTFYLRSPM